jgi:hypothetical protein
MPRTSDSWHFLLCNIMLCVQRIQVYFGFVWYCWNIAISLSFVVRDYRSSKRSDVNCVNIIKSKDLLAWNEDNMSEWSDVSTCGLLFQWPSTIKNSTKHYDITQQKVPHMINMCKLKHEKCHTWLTCVS